ncbi:hypothetical protein AB1N83_007955 [Pleurotus pulmonarius]|nr:hypothetical protein EYR38_002152 [Pleurotus pulmonarius]
MAVLLPKYPSPMNPAKYSRRTATSVMAGAFDIPPPRDVLTSLLNGVGPYKFVEKDEEQRRNRKREKRERERERKRQKAAGKQREPSFSDRGISAQTPAQVASSSSSVVPPAPHPPTASTSSFWRARPAIHIPAMPRSLSVTPPPSFPIRTPSTPASTPGPSDSSNTSRTSSKRPRTPDDFEPIDTAHAMGSPPPSTPRQPRKRRVAVKKGWKGWVEGSPPPSEKLINLDAVPVLQERRTRSGKNFDAIGVGKEGWV